MERTNKSGSKILGFIHYEKHTQDNIAYGMEQAVEQFSVSAEIVTQLLRYSENAMSVSAIYELVRHGCGAPPAIEVPAGWAETTPAAQRRVFEFAALLAAV